jgi:transposase
LRDHKAIARYAGLTGSPDESGKRRHERGLARAGNARVRPILPTNSWGQVGHRCFLESGRFDVQLADVHASIVLDRHSPLATLCGPGMPDKNQFISA